MNITPLLSLAASSSFWLLLERRRVPEDRRRHELLITRAGKALLTKAEASDSTYINKRSSLDS
jgi:DNA-binding MarR family transcriptional regulator